MASASPPRLPVDEAAAEAVAKAFKLDGFFPEFNAELCGKVFLHSGMQRFAAGETLIEQGETGRDLILLLEGSISVMRLSSLGTVSTEVARLKPGDVAGEIALLKDGVRSATLCAETPVLAFRLVYEDVGYILTHNPELAAHLSALARERSGR